MLKERVASIVVASCLAVMLMPAASAYAADSVQLTGKAQMEFVSVSLDTMSVLDYGSAAPGQTVTKTFTARNTGSLAADWDLRGSDATDTADDAWAIGSAAGTNQFVWAAGGMGLNAVKLSTSWLRLADAVPADATHAVNLAFTFPTSARSSLVHVAGATLRATGVGTPAVTSQSISFNNTTGTHETLTAEANRPMNVTFNPSTMGCSANIHFTSGAFAKTSVAMQNVTIHSDGLPVGTYQWKCSMENCCYGTLTVH